jgi:hypothetical protein
MSESDASVRLCGHLGHAARDAASYLVPVFWIADVALT